MREIKFEFILKDECVGGYAFGRLVYTLDYMLEIGIQNDSIIEQATEQFSPANGMDSEFEIIAKRQYTGLKDKNGVEIYEGDIVKEPYYVDEINGFLLLEVVFKDGEFLGKVLNKKGFGLQRLTMYREVIGNIYENPELLKESNNEK